MPAPLAVDPQLEEKKAARLHNLRANRDSAAVATALVAVEAAASGGENVLYPIREALRASATLGEVSGALERVFGRHS